MKKKSIKPKFQFRDVVQRGERQMLVYKTFKSGDKFVYQCCEWEVRRHEYFGYTVGFFEEKDLKLVFKRLQKIA